MVYAYLRVSTENQTVENQRFEIEKFVKTKNLIVDKYVYETVSGGK